LENGIADLTTAGKIQAVITRTVVMVRGQLIKRQKLDNHGHVAVFAVFFRF